MGDMRLIGGLVRPTCKTPRPPTATSQPSKPERPATSTDGSAASTTTRGPPTAAPRRVSSLRLVLKAASASWGRTVQLLGGAVAGPLFIGAFTAIGATRPGYDWQRLPVSSLAIGRHGWLQRINFVVAGVLYSCAGRGLRRSASRRVGPGAVPALVVGVGVGLIGSGIAATAVRSRDYRWACYSAGSDGPGGATGRFGHWPSGTTNGDRPQAARRPRHWCWAGAFASTATTAGIAATRRMPTPHAMATV